MAIPNISATVSYVANGLGPYEIPFKFLENEHLALFEDGESSSRSFTATGAGLSDGGQLTFSTAPDDGVTLTIQRQIPYDQPTQFREGDSLPASTLEESFDRPAMQIQQLDERIQRVLSVPAGETISSLPSKTLRANTRMGFDADGNATIASDDVFVDAAAMESAKTAAESAASTATSAVATATTQATASAESATSAATSAAAILATESSIDAKIAAISSGQGSPDYVSDLLANAPSSANSSGDTEFLRVYAEVSPNEDRNGLYYRLDTETTWTLSPGDLSGRVINLETATTDLKVGPETTSTMPIHGEIDGFGNTITKTGFHVGGEKDGQVFPPQKSNASTLGGSGTYLLSRDGSQALPLLTPSDLKRDYPSFIRKGADMVSRERHAQEAALNAVIAPRASAAVTTYTTSTWGTEATTFQGVAVTARTRGTGELKADAPVTVRHSAFVGILATDGVDVTLTHSVLPAANHWSVATTDPRAVKGALNGGFREWLIPLMPQEPLNGEISYYFKTLDVSVRVCGLFIASDIANPNPVGMARVVPTGTLQNYGQGCLALSNDDLLIATQNSATGDNEVYHLDADTGAVTVADLSAPTAVATDNHNGGSIAILGDGKIIHCSTGHGLDDVMRIAKSTVAVPEDTADWGAVAEVGWTSVTGLTYCQIFPQAGGKVYLVARGRYPNSGIDSFFIAWSDDHGATWNAGDYRGLCDYVYGNQEREYTLGYQDAEKIHFCSLTGSASGAAGELGELYHFYLDTTDENYYQTDGTLIQALTDGPVILGHLSPITEYSIGEYAAGKDLRDHHQSSRVFAQQMAVDSSGVLHIYYVAYQRDDDHDRPEEATQDDVRQLIYRVSYIGGKWVREFIANQGSPYYQTDNGGLLRLGFAVDDNDPETIIFSGDADPNNWTRRGTANDEYYLYRGTKENGVWRYEIIGGPYTEEFLPHYFDRSRGPGGSQAICQLGKFQTFFDVPTSIQALEF